MMSNGMGAMGGMMALWWIGAAIVVVLLTAAIVALVRLSRTEPGAPQGGGSRAVLFVFAAIGLLAVLVLLGGLLMYWGMGGMMGCMTGEASC